MKDYMQQQDKTNNRVLREIDEIKKLKRSTEDHSPLVPRSLDFGTTATTAQHSTTLGVQYHGGSSSMHYGSSAMTQAQGSYFQPSGSSLQPQGSSLQHRGSFSSSGGYMGTLSAQGSYLQHLGSSSQVQGSSSQVHGSMEYPPRPSAPMHTGSNIFQDQGSLRSQQSEVQKFMLENSFPCRLSPHLVP
ncbi:hypothetical protein HanRHA438_Chr16g0757361 [Helianthus annuus]|nr:hypothetical protein HanIR_Chr16g0810281 [Helianthus annuus]KAJ0835615.1 hypothetical protein HanRHA438_Chr16g0757361 [Helianthus annuus]